MNKNLIILFFLTVFIQSELLAMQDPAAVPRPKPATPTLHNAVKLAIIALNDLNIRNPDGCINNVLPKAQSYGEPYKDRLQRIAAKMTQIKQLIEGNSKKAIYEDGLIVCYNDSGNGIALRNGQVWGRGSAADEEVKSLLYKDDPQYNTISRIHFVVSVESYEGTGGKKGFKYYLNDLASKNKIDMNGNEKVTDRTEIKDGDTFKMGAQVFECKLRTEKSDDAQPSAPQSPNPQGNRGGGADLRGAGAGSARPGSPEVTPEEEERMRQLIDMMMRNGGPQGGAAAPAKPAAAGRALPPPPSGAQLPPPQQGLPPKQPVQ